MGFFNKLFETKNKTNFSELLKQGAVIVDVRTPVEYKIGHITGSINIELQKVKEAVTSLKKKNIPVITVCRSGNRSGVAVSILKAAGIEAYNGGAWDVLKKKIA